jgi:hypothetical protein
VISRVAAPSGVREISLAFDLTFLTWVYTSYIYRTVYTIVYVKFSHRRSWFRHVDTLKDTQDSRKGESLSDTFSSFLVIGVYSEINNITSFFSSFRDWEYCCSLVALD